jgi:hypothetical protein
MILPHCKIIYGYTQHCLDNSDDSPILLIEPRNEYIDIIKNLRKRNVILISKALVKSKTSTETSLFYDKTTRNYWIPNDDLNIKGNNCFNIKKYVVFTTTVEHLISQYKIQNIQDFIVNLNILNISNVLDSVLQYNHILSQISINTEINIDKSSKILLYYNSKTDNEAKLTIYQHKNLNLILPNIGIYFLNENYIKTTNDDLSLFVKQYKMNIIINNHTNKTLIPYPDSIEFIESHEKLNNNVSKIFHENVISILDKIFSNDSNNTNVSENLDIIIQFNQKYFNSKNTLQIMHPLKDDTIYIHRPYDIIYANKNCMFMIYQILKSKYFTDYMETKQKEKPIMFKFLCKKYFYDYLSTIFVFKDF